MRPLGGERRRRTAASCPEDEGLPLAEAVLVGQFEFLEWTGDNHLRHSKFIALREDKSALDVKRE